MNSLQKHLTIVIILIANLTYCAGREIPARGSMNVTYSDEPSVETQEKIRSSKTDISLQDAVVSLKLKVMKAANHLKNYFLNYTSSILWRMISEDSPLTYKTRKIRRDIENKGIDSDHSSDRIYIYLSGDKISVLDSNGYNYSDWVKNLTEYPSYDTNGFFYDEDTNGKFNDTYINGTFNDTNTNETEPITPIIPVVLPVCKVGDENCTKCQEISPFCHYMYSESRCVYYNYVHASKLYECGERWFTVDKNEPLLATALLTLVISSSLLGYLIYLRYTVGYAGEATIVANNEYAEMRRVIQLMREKYPNVVQDIQSSSNQSSS